MTELAVSDYNRAILATLRPASRIYWAALGVLFLGIVWGAICWTYQIDSGMGVAGISHPVGWGVYIVNFVF